jgi:molybdopterin-guanine dinucleotide biosynthesis protein A
VTNLPSRAEVAGIVLAGGAGRRFGAGRSKAWLTTAAGDPLLQVALASLVRVAERLIVAAPAGMRLPIPLPAPNELAGEDAPAFSTEVVHDLAADEGPLAGLVPALEQAMAYGATRAFILAVDMPRFTPGEFARLAAPLERAPGAVAVVPRTPAGLEPMFSCVRPAPVATVFRASWDTGERAVHAAFRALGPDGLIELDTTDPAAWPGGPARLRSINVPADLPSVLAEDDRAT